MTRRHPPTRIIYTVTCPDCGSYDVDTDIDDPEAEQRGCSSFRCPDCGLEGLL